MILRKLSGNALVLRWNPSKHPRTNADSIKCYYQQSPTFQSREQRASEAGRPLAMRERSHR